MKLQKILMITIFVLILTVGAVSASNDNQTSDSLVEEIDNTNIEATSCDLEQSVNDTSPASEGVNGLEELSVDDSRDENHKVGDASSASDDVLSASNDDLLKSDGNNFLYNELWYENLDEAFDAADHNGGGVIYVLRGTYGSDGNDIGIELSYAVSITLQPLDTNHTVIFDAADNNWFFKVTDAGALLTINNIIFKRGQALPSDGGGAIEVNGRLVLNNCTFEGNKAHENMIGDYGLGGAINVDEGSLTANDCRFINNWAGQKGGAICIENSGSATLRNCYFEGNTKGNETIPNDFDDYEIGSGETADWRFENCHFIGSGSIDYEVDSLDKTVSVTPRVDDDVNYVVLYKEGSYYDEKPCASGYVAEFTDLDKGTYKIYMAKNEEKIYEYTGTTFTILEPNFVLDGTTAFETLSAAVNAISSGGSGVITVEGKIFNDSPNFNVQIINKDVTIMPNPSAGDVIFSADSQSYLLEIGSNSKLTIYGITIKGNFSDSALKFSTNLECNISGCVFENINGSPITAQNSSLVIEGTTFDSNGLIIFIGTLVNIDDCTFTNNSGIWGGAINADSSTDLTVTDSEFTDNEASDKGGAVFVEDGATATFNNCYFDGNQAIEDGGAVYFAGTGNVSNCDFINNTAAENGGALFIGGDYCELHNSTFTDNFAGNDAGAIEWDGSHGIVYNITCTNNQGVSMSTNLSNGGTIALRGDNITISKSRFTKSSAKIAGGAIFAAGNLINITDSEFSMCNVSLEDDPKAGKAYSTGGGAIYVLGNCSNIENCVFSRNIGKHGGALYIQGHEVNVKNITTDFSYSSLEGGAVFVEGKNATISDSSFTRSNSTASKAGTIYVGGDNAAIINSVVRMSHAPDDGGAVYIRGNSALIANCTFEMCTSDKNGGAIFLYGGYCNVIDSSFNGSCAANSGGAIYATGSNSIVADSIFTNNLAEYHGGAIYWYSGSRFNTVDGCTFTGNVAHATRDHVNQAYGGGALYWSNSEYCILKNSSFYNNSVQSTTGKVDGGAVVWDYGNHVLIDNCLFEGNYVTTTVTSSSVWIQGGAMFLRLNANYTVSNCEFRNCSSDGEAGALYIQVVGSSMPGCLVVNTTFISNVAKGIGINIDGGGAVQIKDNNGWALFDNVTFINNTANKGGAVTILSIRNMGGVEFSDCTFDGNKATEDDGGAVQIDNNIQGLILFDNVGFINNTADKGGAIAILYNNNGEHVFLSNCNFIGNNVSDSGGALYFTNKANVSNCIFINNSATTGEGGAIYWIGGGGNVTDSTFTRNTAGENGGAVYADFNVEIIHSIFRDNEAVLGGAIYNCNHENCTFEANSRPQIYPYSKVNTTMEITAVYEEDLMITVTLPEDATGDVNITVADKLYSRSITSGSCIIHVSDLSSGTYKISVTYGGDVNYLAASNSTTVTISKTAPEITVDAGNVVYGETESVNVTLPIDATGTVEFTLLDGNSQVINNKNLILSGGTASYTLPEDLNVGRYILNTQYFGDSRYEGNSSSREFFVSPKISITPDVTIDDDGVITMDLGNVTGSINVYVDGEEDGNSKIKGGKFAYILLTGELTVGNHSIHFKYLGTDFDENVFNYWDNDTGSYKPILYPFSIHKKQSESEAETKGEILDVILEDEKGNVLVNATGNVEFTIINEFTGEVTKIVIEIVNGIASLDISQFKDGNYIISWYYAGDDKHVSMSDTMVLEISRRVLGITAGDMSTVYSSSQSYSVMVYGIDRYPVAGVPVTFLINGMPFKTVKTDRNGFASVAVTQTPGTYRITVKSQAVSVTRKLTVMHVLSLSKVKVKRTAKKITIKATLKKVNGKYLKGKKITFRFNGKKYTAKTNKKGVAKITVKKNVLKKLRKGKKVTYQATYLKDTVKKSVKVR